MAMFLLNYFILSVSDWGIGLQFFFSTATVKGRAFSPFGIEAELAVAVFFFINIADRNYLLHQTQIINKYFFEKNKKRGVFRSKKLRNTPLKRLFCSPNPPGWAKTAMCIFFSAQKIDFQKSEKTRDKTRKTEENLGFFEPIFFGPT